MISQVNDGTSATFAHRGGQFQRSPKTFLMCLHPDVHTSCRNLPFSKVLASTRLLHRKRFQWLKLKRHSVMQVSGILYCTHNIPCTFSQKAHTVLPRILQSKWYYRRLGNNKLPIILILYKLRFAVTWFHTGFFRHQLGKYVTKHQQADVVRFRCVKC
jgi:hypothetical protein